MLDSPRNEVYAPKSPAHDLYLTLEKEKNMKLKKSLMAITTATAVAISGTAVASAQNAPAGSLETITDGGVTGSLGGDATTDPATDNDTTPADETEDSATGSDKFFGWDADTKPFEKLTSIAAVFTTVVGIVGGIATLVGTIMKISDMLAPKN